MTPTDVTDAGDGFEIHVDGARAGRTGYRDEPEGRIFDHTEIDEAHAGQGLGSALIQAALDATRAESRAVIHACGFVRGYIAKHPDYVDLVPDERRAEFGLA